MAEEEGQRRRHSTRIRRESAAKREAEEPVSPRAAKVAKTTPTSKPTSKSKATEKPKGATRSKQQRQSQPSQHQSKETTPTPRVDVLPSRLVEGKPLPTLTQLPTEYGPDYQSIKDSGVIAAALARSRKRWMTDGVFEKYWTKPPPKKKGDPAQPRDRHKPGDRQGTCKLVVEPHVFDVTIYAVNEKVAHSQGQQYHQYNPPTNAPSQGYNSQYPPRPADPPRVPYQPHNQPPPPNRTNVQPSTPANNYQNHQVAPSPRPAQQPSQPPSGGDPVIQMLAQRASTNPELKSVMKIVATGHANQEQLEYFQKHIDELHKIVDEQKARDAAKAARPPPPPVRPAAPSTQPYAKPPQSSSYTHNTATPSYGTPQSFQPQPYHAPTPQRFVPQPKLKAVLIEFDKDPTSRFLFPENSIVDYGPGFRTCTVSFLAKRKAKDAEDSARYLDLARSQLEPGILAKKAEDIDFWQPVTVTFQCDVPNSQVLQLFSRAARKPQEVSAWMEKMLNGEEEVLPKKEPVSASKEAQSNGAEKPAADGAVKPPGDAPAKPTIEPEKGKIKKEDGVNGTTRPVESGRRRAESRKLAVRLPKEETAIEIVV